MSPRTRTAGLAMNTLTLIFSLTTLVTAVLNARNYPALSVALLVVANMTGTLALGELVDLCADCKDDAGKGAAA